MENVAIAAFNMCRARPERVAAKEFISAQFGITPVAATSLANDLTEAVERDGDGDSWVSQKSRLQRYRAVSGF